MPVDADQSSLEQQWEAGIVPLLEEYIRIPCVSPLFDPRWQEHGYIDRALALLADWATRQQLPGMRVEQLQLPGRTPLLLVEVPGTVPGEVLLYGHLDKQPPMEGWRERLGPWTPVREGEKLYGRGGADDGYALFACLSALGLLHRQGRPHARCLILIEASEESGSPDLPAWLEQLEGRLGQPDLVVCLDSGCGNYEQLWCTTSLRGLIGGELEIGVLQQGVHSGDAGGVVADPFRLLRQLLERIEEPGSGRIRLPECHCPIPKHRLAEAEAVARTLGEESWSRFPFLDGVQPAASDPLEAVLARSWRPALTVLGLDGLPPCGEAGNLHPPVLRVRLSLRLPPACPAAPALAALQQTLERDPPCNARVRLKPDWCADGWQAPETAPWLENALRKASREVFGKPALSTGEGFSIPFMAMLGERFPEAQFLITGVLGPGSNAHGPNEFLHLGMARRLSACLASVLADHAAERAHG